jgi:hypothetical protein
MALPLLVQATPLRGERALRVLVGLAVCLHVWTAISLLGRRYFLGG